MLNEAQKRFVGLMMPNLDERTRKIFLCAYSEFLGRGGISDLSELTGVSRTTITTGRMELSDLSVDPRGKKRSEGSVRQRAAGGGRKKAEEKYPEFEKTLLSLLDGNTIGNPENPLCWTTKSLRNLESELIKKGIKVTYPTIRTKLEELGFSLQQNKKYVETGDPGPDRNAQFEFINNQSKTFLDAGMPVISVDTKKKELIGKYKNNGAEYRPHGEPIHVNDHDFMDQTQGKASPYGVYDIGANEGFVSVGLSADTGAFAVNSIRSWWVTMGKERYPNTTALMITADGGGSNGRRNKLWKTSLQQFADETGLRIYVSHFPPGTSKWNKIEHRLFSFISKNWRGRPLETIEIIVNLIASTTTNTGLSVKCQVDNNIYEKGIKVTEKELASLNIESSTWHGEWNYAIMPHNHKWK